MGKQTVLQIKLLGKPEIWLDGRRLTRFKTAKTEALIYYLAATGQLHSRESLAGLLWAEMPDAAARRNLTKSLTVLRRTCGPYMIIESGQVGFDPAANLDLDLAQFNEAISNFDLAEPGINLYRGDFLDGFYVKDAIEFENWQLAQRQSLREAATALLEHLIEKSEAERDYTAGITYLHRLIKLDPWREEAQRRLMAFLARTGQLNAALAQYKQFSTELGQELGVEPAAETVAFARRLRAARQKPAFPLPHEASPLVGRERELSRIQELLAGPECRLLTITGLGGSGKTRLAIAAAHQAYREAETLFINGVAFFSLADLTSGSAVPLTLANTLDAPLSGSDSPRTALLHFLANKEMLLVLDNFEHLIDQADLITELLAACPDIKFLVTSREPFNTSAEWRIILRGLTLPPPEEEDPRRLGDYASVSLFLRSAAQVRASFALTAENARSINQLCHLIDGLPLALQLSATWLRAMPLSDILAALEQGLDLLATDMRDIPQRQRSMRAIFESTWNLLSGEEKTVMETLSICRDGFNQEAAKAIAGADPLLLSQIIDHALLSHQGQSRYLMHPLTRQYAGEMLSAKGDAAAAAEKHGRFYLSWLAGMEDKLFGPTPHLVSNTLKEELGNLNQAWDWALENKQTALVSDTLTALVTFYDLMGMLPEGEHLLDQALQAFNQAGDPDQQRLLGRLLIAKAQVGSARGNYDRAQKNIRKAQELVARLNDDLLIGDIHDTRGRIFTDTGHYVPAKEHYWRAIAIYRHLGNDRKLANALSSIGWTAIIDDSLAEAVPVLQEALTIERKIGHKRGEALAQGNLAVALSIQGEHEIALLQNLETLALYEEMGDMLNIERRKNNLAMNLQNLGRLCEAQQFATQAFDLAQELGALPEKTNAMDTLGMIYIATGQYAQAQSRLEEAHQLAKEMGYTYLDLSLQALLVNLYNRTGQFDRLENALPAFQTLAERMENGFYIARALAETAYLAQANGDLQKANQHLDQAINIIHGHLAQGDLPFLLLRQADLLHELGRNSEGLPLVEEASAIADRSGHQPLLFCARSMSGNLLQALDRSAAAAVQAESACSLLPNLEPFPDVLSGLLHLAHYHFAMSDPELARNIADFVANHPASSHLSCQKALRLLEEMAATSPSQLETANPLQWPDLVSLICE